jgi:hypothetical protein
VAVRVGSIGRLQVRKVSWHTIGEIWVDVPSITVKGTTATVKSCMDNTSADVSQKGTLVEMPEPYLSAVAKLHQVAGTGWTVNTVDFVKQQCR